MKLYTRFLSSLPDDDRIIRGEVVAGRNVADRLRFDLQQRGYPVTEPESYEDFGWHFFVGHIGLFEFRPNVWCLLQGGGDPWLLITEPSKIFFIPQVGFYRRVTDDLKTILAGDPVFSNSVWMTPKEYDRLGRQ